MTYGLLSSKTGEFVDMVCPVNILHPFNRGLVAWWKTLPGNTGGPRFMDISNPGPRGKHGTLTDMDPARDWVGTRYHGAQAHEVLDFDGIDDFVEVADHSLLQFTTGDSITMTAWIRPDQVSAVGTIFGKGREAVDNEANYFLRQDATGLKPEFYFNQSGTTDWHIWTTTDNQITVAGVWYFIAVTYTFGTGSSIKMYVNGAETPGSWWIGDGDSSPDVPTDPLTIGKKKHITGGNELYDGQMDDIRIQRTILSPFDILELYHESLAGHPSTLNWIDHRVMVTAAAAGGSNHMLAGRNTSPTLSSPATWLLGPYT